MPGRKNSAILEDNHILERYPLNGKKGENMRIIVGVTGATGVEMSYELLLALRRAGCEVHLIVSRSAQMTWDYESRMPLQRNDLANFVYRRMNWMQ